MTQNLDMSLDDIIRNKKKPARSGTNTSLGGGGRSHSHGRARGDGRNLDSGTGPGPTRRSDSRFTNRPNPYIIPLPQPQGFRVPEMLVGGKSNSEGETKLYVSNLDYEVTNEDIKVLFSDVGELKRYSIHYDKSGRSKGTAEVVYMRQTDAVAAVKRYNNVQLDGKPMKLELVTPVPVPVPPMQRGILGNNPIIPSRSIQGRIAVGRGQEQQRGGGLGRGNVGPRKEKVLSAKDLDADLERYRLQAMHIT